MGYFNHNHYQVPTNSISAPRLLPATAQTPNQLSNTNTNTTTKDTCHILRSSSLSSFSGSVLFDFESIWCTICQRPKFEDGVCEEVCICVSYSSINTNTGMPRTAAVIPTANMSTDLSQPSDNGEGLDMYLNHTTFTDSSHRSHDIYQQREHTYDAVDPWLYGCASSCSYETGYDASQLPVFHAIGECSSNEDGDGDTSSEAASGVTDMTRGSSAVSSPSPSSACGRGRGRSVEPRSLSRTEVRKLVDGKERRREQNRKSQLRFRERKRGVERELMEKIECLKQVNGILMREVEGLRRRDCGGQLEFCE
ncbi:hypothetical protein VTL71DRAFT_5811 [Oculimacula yallundae]|uniref:BZIP domain-containing protein n=1 Tax=Oculimacula yallundae TaxID=86028 RepID=A0ABR4BYK4_9HELO